jgi:hypothetical protein
LREELYKNMAVKEKKSYRLDSQLVSEFQKVCKRKGISFSAGVESMMKEFIAKSESGVHDEVYAPMVQQAVKKAVEDQIDRLAGMIYNVQVDTNAVLQSVPILYQKNMFAMEYTVNKFLNEELLSPHRDYSSKRFEWEAHGKKMIDDFRKRSLTDLKVRKRVKLG